MIFKLLPLFVLLGIGVRFLAQIAAVRANMKRRKAQQDGRLEQYYADKEAFWRNVDRVCLVIAGAAAIWYIVGIGLWLFGA